MCVQSVGMGWWYVQWRVGGAQAASRSLMPSSLRCGELRRAELHPGFGRGGSGGGVGAGRIEVMRDWGLGDS